MAVLEVITREGRRCHVYVDAAHLFRLPKLSTEESDLLDSSDQRMEFSRLSCKLPFMDDLRGMSVTVPREE
jgi:ferredoxin, 2Fe-2S